MELKTNERLELVEQHLKEIQKDIANISSALVGNKENGNRGFIHEIQGLKEEVELIKEDLNKVKTENAKKDVYIAQLKYVVSGCIGLILAYIFGLITK